MRSGIHQRCRHCGSEEVRMNRANDTIQCETCDRILEERYNDFRTTTVLLDRDSPFPIVTQDGLSKYKFEESQLDNDPFHSTGFITAFSQTNLQPMGAFTLTARTFPGDLAELERILREIGMDMSVGMGKVAERAARGGDSGTDPAYDVKLRKILCAYFQVQEMADVLDLHVDDCDEAIRVVKVVVDSAAPDVGIGTLSAASLVLAQQSSGRQTPIAELAEVSGESESDIENAVQMVKSIRRASEESANAAQEAAQSPMSDYLQRFCSLLGMTPSTEQLAMRIGQNTTQNGVCARRNPHSVAAAVIYLAFNLEDQKKTQTEVCKVTGLTEVTLRKVYKELLAEHRHIIPSDYAPKVPLKRLLPAGGTPSTLRGPGAASGASWVPQPQLQGTGGFEGWMDPQLMIQQLVQAMAMALPQNQEGMSAEAMHQTQQALMQIAASMQSLVQGGQEGGEAPMQSGADVSLFSRQFETLQNAVQQRGGSRPAKR